MAVELIYKHQKKTYELMKTELNEKGRVAYIYPVGGGKSFPILKYIEENPDKKVLLNNNYFSNPSDENDFQLQTALDYLEKLKDTRND